MATVIGTVTGPIGQKQEMVLQAMQQALENAPPPPSGFDVQTFKLLSIEFEHGGFTGTTRTRVSLDVQPGSWPT